MNDIDNAPFGESVKEMTEDLPVESIVIPDNAAETSSNTASISNEESSNELDLKPGTPATEDVNVDLSGKKFGF